MVPDAASLAAAVIVMVSLAYFSMASFPFVLVRLDIPEVWRLFRGLFNVHFRVIGVVGLAAAVAFATSGHILVTFAMVALAVWASALRGLVLDRMDTQQAAWQSGDVGAMRRLRAIHWGAMLANVAVLAGVVSSLSSIF